MSDKVRIVERAREYPYEIPDRSFEQVGRQTRDLADEPRLESRVPVLRARLRDLDIVYSAHISAYGSIPAAIQVSPGTTVSTYVTYLTPGQLTTMSETEPNYTLVRLDPVSCELETGEELTSVSSYLSRHGCLSVDGSEVALAAVEAVGRRFPELDEEEAIEHVRLQLAAELSPEDFIAENVADPAVARARTEVLRTDSKPFAGHSRKLSEY